DQCKNVPNHRDRDRVEVRRPTRLRAPDRRRDKRRCCHREDDAEPEADASGPQCRELGPLRGEDVPEACRPPWGSQVVDRNRTCCCRGHDRVSIPTSVRAVSTFAAGAGLDVWYSWLFCVSSMNAVSRLARRSASSWISMPFAAASLPMSAASIPVTMSAPSAL